MTDTEVSIRSVGVFTLDSSKRMVTRGEYSVCLQPQQWRLFNFLTQHPYTLMRKEELYENIASESYKKQPIPKIVEILICNLRKKLERLGSSSQLHIVTTWGVGYTFMPSLAGEMPVNDPRVRDAWKRDREQQPHDRRSTIKRVELVRANITR